MSKKIAVFPGSYDPFTLGHLAVVEKALPLFDEIIVAIGENTTKTSYFTLDERIKHIQKVFVQQPKIKVESFSGLTVDFCKKNNAQFIIRGLRDGKDFDFEKSIALMNYQLNPKVETLFFMTQAEYAHINSSIVREILKNKGDISSFLPHEIVQIIKKG